MGKDEPAAVRLACARCGRTLTQTCRWGSDADRMPTGECSGIAEIPQGIMIRSGKADVLRWVDDDDRVVRELEASPAGALAINPADLLPEVLESCGFDSGCCGSDGMDGPNRACLCGNLVATEWSDCWTVHEVRFIPDAVSELDGAAHAPARD